MNIEQLLIERDTLESILSKPTTTTIKNQCQSRHSEIEYDIKQYLEV